jgi:anaerobic selenocysteine-containing dehydrogenase
MRHPSIFQLRPAFFAWRPSDDGLSALQLGGVRKAVTGPLAPQGAAVTIRKSICTHCAVGCTVTAEVANSVWVGQEPSWDSPINQNSHCANGASVRELVFGEQRLKYPLKLVDGQWRQIIWGGNPAEAHPVSLHHLLEGAELNKANVLSIRA